MDHAVDLTAVLLTNKVRQSCIRSHRKSDDQVHENSNQRHTASHGRQRLFPRKSSHNGNIR